ncbi:hypothetical protein [Lachnospira multipara]|uniref:Uncharacterized protein n=1 Tax=Lachnospira multipara TaxID=28051 RepID=A0A1H5TU18_9FIRM|nr:hypothetical protein [Lachnospira multipara]SEF66325.1 hypothetical protein SAMN05216537_105125 [Lachnospira multipara]
MKKERKERIKRILHSKAFILCFTFLFLILSVMSIAWYYGKYKPFHKYYVLMEKSPYFTGTKGQPYNKDNAVWDGEKYTLSVCMPAYLLWADGNLAISSPMELVGPDPENPGKMMYVMGDHGLIIWLEDFTGNIKELGVILDGRQIYLEDSRTARYEEYQPYVDENTDKIDILFRKAEDLWGLEMPWKE